MYLKKQFSKARTDNQFDSGIKFEVECEKIADIHAVNFSKYLLSQIYNMTHGNKAGISIEDLLIIYKKPL